MNAYPSSRHLSFTRPVQVMAVEETHPEVMNELFTGGMKPNLSSLLEAKSVSKTNFP